MMGRLHEQARRDLRPVPLPPPKLGTELRGEVSEWQSLSPTQRIMLQSIVALLRELQDDEEFQEITRHPASRPEELVVVELRLMPLVLQALERLEDIAPDSWPDTGWALDLASAREQASDAAQLLQLAIDMGRASTDRSGCMKREDLRSLRTLQSILSSILKHITAPYPEAAQR
jgi:hypothetical protein